MKKTMPSITIACPLINFGSFSQEFYLDNNTCIRSATGYYKKLKGRTKLDPFKYDVILVHRHYYSDDDLVGPHGYIDHIRLVLAFLRVLMNKDAQIFDYINADQIFEENELFIKPKETSEEHDHYLEKFKKFRKRFNKKSLVIALLNNAFDPSEVPANQNLFTVMALENILLKESQGGYKFALRGAFRLYPDDVKKRKEMFDFLSLAYKYRSKYAHGNDVGFEKIMKEISSPSKFRKKLKIVSRKLFELETIDPMSERELEKIILEGYRIT